jgi:hypothetical protein
MVPNNLDGIFKIKPIFRVRELNLYSFEEKLN